MANLYDLSTDSNHVKFFTWMWGFDPTTKYKTMCPYFWQYVLSIVILPVILLYKLVMWLNAPFKRLWDAYGERQGTLVVNRLLAEINAAKTDEDFYKIYESKCYEPNKFGIFDVDPDFDGDIFDTIYTRWVAYKRLKADRKYDKKIKTQRQIDEFKYGTGGTVLSYILGGGALVGLGFFIYWVLHLFTMSQFLTGLLALAILIALVGLGFLGVSFIQYIRSKIPCDNKVSVLFRNIVFWKYVGLFFVAIWKGLCIIFDMIGNIYRKNCPTIKWG